MDADHIERLAGLSNAFKAFGDGPANTADVAALDYAIEVLSVAQGRGLEHIGWEGRTVWPGVEPAGWWGMANRPDEVPLAHPHTQYRRIYAGPVEAAAPAQPDGVE